MIDQVVMWFEFDLKFEHTLAILILIAVAFSQPIRLCGYETNSHRMDVEGHVTAVMRCPDAGRNM